MLTALYIVAIGLVVILLARVVSGLNTMLDRLRNLELLSDQSNTLDSIKDSMYEILTELQNHSSALDELKEQASHSIVRDPKMFNFLVENLAGDKIDSDCRLMAVLGSIDSHLYGIYEDQQHIRDFGVAQAINTDLDPPLFPSER